jgi:hypothetical protein
MTVRILGLSGATVLTETYSPCTGEHIEATLSEIEVRKLFDSSNPYDDRGVYYVIPSEGTSYKYRPEDTLEGNGTPA